MAYSPTLSSQPSTFRRAVRQLEEALFEAQRGAEAVAPAADSSQHSLATGTVATEQPQERS